MLSNVRAVYRPCRRLFRSRFKNAGPPDDQRDYDQRRDTARGPVARNFGITVHFQPPSNLAPPIDGLAWEA